MKQNKSRKVWRPPGLSGELQLADCMAHESTKKCQALFQALASIIGRYMYGTFSISPPQIPVIIMKKTAAFFFNFQISYHCTLFLNLNQPGSRPQYGLKIL